MPLGAAGIYGWLIDLCVFVVFFVDQAGGGGCGKARLDKRTRKREETSELKVERRLKLNENKIIM